jgi:hypothetical protein
MQVPRERKYSISEVQNKENEDERESRRRGGGQ